VSLTSPTNGQSLVYDSGTSKWINATGGGGGVTPAYGQMYEISGGNGLALSGGSVVYSGWVTPISAGIQSLVAFGVNATANRLTVGTGGGGVYRVSYTMSYAGTNGNKYYWTVHLNDNPINWLTSQDQADLSLFVTQTAVGLLTLADGDYVDLRVATNASSDTIYTYRGSLVIERIG
jgi:hypothetical protein